MHPGVQQWQAARLLYSTIWCRARTIDISAENVDEAVRGVLAALDEDLGVGCAPLQQIWRLIGVQYGRGNLAKLVAAIPLLVRPVIEHTVPKAHLRVRYNELL